MPSDPTMSGDGGDLRAEIASMASALIRKGSLSTDELREKLNRLIDLLDDSDSGEASDPGKPGEEEAYESRGHRRRRVKAASMSNREMSEFLHQRR